jgi:predicted dehydrogenase
MNPIPDPSRRDFLSLTLGAAALGAAENVFSQPLTGTIRLGLVGCGGRGTGAALQALAADPHAELVAMADVFEDRLELSVKSMSKHKLKKRIDVPEERRFTGLDGYKALLESDVDVVLLATPPGFRPLHIKAAIDAGKHVFAEKPVAVDTAGVKTVLAACRKAQAEKLFVVSGLHVRYEPRSQQLVQAVRDGVIGDLMSMRLTRHGGGVWTRPEPEDATPVEKQLRNWYYYTWLSGDFLVEQFVHEIDRCAWLIGEYPIHCRATGGRQVRTSDKQGHIYDHFAAEFQFASGVELCAFARQQRGTDRAWDITVNGTRGRVRGRARRQYDVFENGEKEPIKVIRGSKDGHQVEHDELFAGLRGGAYINNGEYMAKSTLMAIMMRDAAYSGKDLKWDDMMKSDEPLVDMENLTFDSELPLWKVPVPGVNGVS